MVATQFFAGTTTNMSEKNMDSSESVVKKTLVAFDQGKNVAYPTRLACDSACCCQDFFLGR
jgi:hypothetical protein